MDFDAFERRMLLRRIEHIDAEISETKRQIERHGANANELDFETLRLQQEARKNYSKCLAVMMEQASLGEGSAVGPKPVAPALPVSPQPPSLTPPPASDCDGPKTK